MDFYLGRNLAGHEFALTDVGDILEDEFNLYTQDGIVARLEDIYSDWWVSIRDFTDVYGESGGYYDINSIDGLNEFLKKRFLIKLTEEFLNYRLAKMMMDKLVEWGYDGILFGQK